MVQRRKDSHFLPYGAALFVLLLAIDQWTKHVIVSRYALGVSHEILPHIWFTYVRNTGALWSMFQDTNLLFIVLSLVAFAVLAWYRAQFRTHIEKLCLTLLSAGIAGNLVDRMMRGFVVDFIDLRWWPVFNLADSAIVVGIVIYLLEQIRNDRARVRDASVSQQRKAVTKRPSRKR